MEQLTYVFHETNRHGTPKRILGVINSVVYPDKGLAQIDKTFSPSKAYEVPGDDGTVQIVYETAHADGTPFYWSITAYKSGVLDI